MSRLQIIFVVETCNGDKSDSLYLRTVLDHFFTFECVDFDGEAAVQTICLGGKQHYNDKKV